MSIFSRIALLLVCLALSACSPKKPQEPESWAPSKAAINRNITIWIDAGHGGVDPGATNRKFKLQEKTLCLKTAQLVQKKLVAMGYCVRMLRPKDEYVSLDKRVSIANSDRYSVMVSIHFNSARNTAADGVEVYYYSPERGLTDLHRLSKILATKIEKKVIASTKATTRGVKIGSFRVIRSSAMPSCLIEGGFLTNAKEAKKLSQSSYLNYLANGIAEGIDAFCLEYSSKVHNLKNSSALN